MRRPGGGKGLPHRWGQATTDTQDHLLRDRRGRFGHRAADVCGEPVLEDGKVSQLMARGTLHHFEALRLADAPCGVNTPPRQVTPVIKAPRVTETARTPQAQS